ncbi:MAG: acyl-CoA dehydrogenase family protein, partial [Streptosporangiaceae bacterium]
MALAVTEEHQALAESVRGWAERNAGAQVLRPSVDAPDGGSAHYAETLHPALAAQGLLGLHLPEGQGGQGFGLAELTVAVAELGRRMLPGGYLPTVLASAALAAAGADSKLVTSLADGTRCGAVSLATGITGTAGADGGLVLAGACAPVLGGSLADLVVLPVAAEGREIWVAVDTAALNVTPLDSLDLTRSVARLDAEGVAVPAERVLTGLDRRTVTGLAAVLLGAEAAGLAGWAVSTAAEYSKIRNQFGRPIGQFQAVKHRCARMLTQAEQADAVVWDAARALDHVAGPAGETTAQETTAQETTAQAEFAAAVAATIAVDAAVECAHECIQVLGGIGYTWEHEAHLYYRRALSLRALLGPAGRWAEQAARLATGGVRRKLEIDLPDDAAVWRSGIRAELAEIAGLSWT